MSPEKVAVLVVTALITCLLATALVNAEKGPGTTNGGAVASTGLKSVGGPAGGTGSPPQARRTNPLDDLTYDDLRGGRFRPAPPKKPETAGPAVPPPEPRDYKIKKGESLRTIAKRECGGERFVAAIVELNPGLNPSKLQAGQTIKIPPKRDAAAKTSKPGAEAVKADGAATPKSPAPGTNGQPAKRSAKSSAKPTSKTSAVKPKTV